jgi:hypothetical protein
MKNMNIQFSLLATLLAVVLMVPSAVRAQSAAATYKAKCAAAMARTERETLVQARH